MANEREGGEAMLALYWLLACIKEQEATSAIRVLGLAFFQTQVPHERCLLIAEALSVQRNATGVGEKHHHRKNERNKSGRTQVMGMPASGPETMRPYSSAELLITGRIAIGMSNSWQAKASHWSVLRFMSMVRLALVTSVTCTPPLVPPVKFCNCGTHRCEWECHKIGGGGGRQREE